MRHINWAMKELLGCASGEKVGSRLQIEQSQCEGFYWGGTFHINSVALVIGEVIIDSIFYLLVQFV